MRTVWLLVTMTAIEAAERRVGMILRMSWAIKKIVSIILCCCCEADRGWFGFGVYYGGIFWRQAYGKGKPFRVTLKEGKWVVKSRELDWGRIRQGMEGRDWQGSDDDENTSMCEFNKRNCGKRKKNETLSRGQAAKMGSLKEEYWEFRTVSFLFFTLKYSNL